MMLGHQPTIGLRLESPTSAELVRALACGTPVGARICTDCLDRLAVTRQKAGGALGV